MKPKHGAWGTRLYTIYIQMKQRCYNPNRREYKNYGGRGIAVCDEWKDNFSNFADWAILNGYSDDLTIDRIDVNRNYEPSNCRWATIKQQQRNTTRNRYITAFGETKTMAEWAEQNGLSQDLIKDRLNKLHWSAEDAVSTPRLTGRYKKRRTHDTND